MNILELRVLQGLEDQNLLTHITRMERIQNQQDCGCGLSEREKVTLEILYQRLDEITTP